MTRAVLFWAENIKNKHQFTTIANMNARLYWRSYPVFCKLIKLQANKGDELMFHIDKSLVRSFVSH